MPVKYRSAKQRRPSFSAEALALFTELEAEQARHRHRQDFRDKAYELARLLSLTPEWWTGNCVTDRSRAPCHPPEYVAHQDWIRVRAVRERLLTAVGGRHEAPAPE
jgi:hypothetical protein